jgi:hypothetical protein
MLNAFILPDTPPLIFWTCCAAAITILGISKSGLTGAAILSLPILMMVMPVDKVAASMLPLLVLCDINAIYHHRRNVVWPKVMDIYIPAIVGIAAGAAVWWWVGQEGVDKFSLPLKRFVGVIAILFGLYIGAREASMKWVEDHHPGKMWATVSGVTAGFTTTLAHAAGPVVSLYLFSQKLGKNHFVGTMAWTFMLLNLTKLPFYAGVGMFSKEIFLFDLFLVPLIPVGSFMGKWILDHIAEKVFNRVIMVLAVLSGIQLLFNIPLIQMALEYLK